MTASNGGSMSPLVVIGVSAGAGGGNTPQAIATGRGKEPYLPHPAEPTGIEPSPIDTGLSRS